MPSPRFQEISIGALARALGVDRRTVAKRLQALPPEATLEEIIGALITLEGIEEARRRETLARAKLRELELQKEQGELIRKADILQDLIVLFKWFRNEVVLLCPRKVASELVGKSEREITTILFKTLGEIFENVRIHFPTLPDSPPDGVSPVIAHRVPVGSTNTPPQPRKLRRTRTVEKPKGALSGRNHGRLE